MSALELTWKSAPLEEVDTAESCVACVVLVVELGTDVPFDTFLVVPLTAVPARDGFDFESATRTPVTDTTPTTKTTSRLAIRPVPELT